MAAQDRGELGNGDRDRVPYEIRVHLRVARAYSLAVKWFGGVGRLEGMDSCGSGFGIEWDVPLAEIGGKRRDAGPSGA